MIGTLWSLSMCILFAALFARLYRVGGARRGTVLAILIALSAFLGLLVAVFRWGWWIPEDWSGAAYFGTVLVAVAISGGLLYSTSFPIFQKVSQAELQLTQGFRVVVGAGFLMFGALGLIPVWFSLLDAALHITSGMLALRAAYAIADRSGHRRPLLWTANLVGISDILIIVSSIAFVVWNDLGPLHPMHLVVFGVGPILLWLHFMSVVNLIRER